MTRLETTPGLLLALGAISDRALDGSEASHSEEIPLKAEEVDRVCPEELEDCGELSHPTEQNPLTSATKVVKGVSLGWVETSRWRNSALLLATSPH